MTIVDPQSVEGDGDRAAVDGDGLHPRLGAIVLGLGMGLGVHLIAVALFIALWYYQRAEAPTCFPDEDGIVGTLVLVLLLDMVVTGVVWFFARRQRWLMRGFAIGWLLGLVPVVLGVAEVLAFTDTLGMGCGGSDRTPW